MWYNFDESLPEPGQKAVFVLDDRSSVIMGLVISLDGLEAEDETQFIDVLEAEHGDSVGASLDGSIWAYLPVDFELHFMTLSQDDWY